MNKAFNNVRPTLEEESYLQRAAGRRQVAFCILKVGEVHGEVTVFLLLANVWAHLEQFALMVEKRNVKKKTTFTSGYRICS